MQSIPKRFEWSWKGTLFWSDQSSQIDSCIYIMPATNSTNTLSERSFSALCRLNYTDQVGLNSCMTLHVHKNELTNFLCQGLVMSLSSLTVAEYHMWIAYLVLLSNSIHCSSYYNRTEKIGYRTYNLPMAVFTIIPICYTSLSEIILAVWKKRPLAFDLACNRIWGISVAPEGPWHHFFSPQSRRGYVLNYLWNLYYYCTVLQFLKDTWFALAELVFLHVWLFVHMDLVLAHCIHALEERGRGHDLNNFLCTFTVNYPPPHSQFASDIYARNINTMIKPPTEMVGVCVLSYK